MEYAATWHQNLNSAQMSFTQWDVFWKAAQLLYTLPVGFSSAWSAPPTIAGRVDQCILMVGTNLNTIVQQGEFPYIHRVCGWGNSIMFVQPVYFNFLIPYTTPCPMLRKMWCQIYRVKKKIQRGQMSVAVATYFKRNTIISEIRKVEVNNTSVLKHNIDCVTHKSILSQTKSSEENSSTNSHTPYRHK